MSGVFKAFAVDVKILGRSVAIIAPGAGIFMHVDGIVERTDEALGVGAVVEIGIFGMSKACYCEQSEQKCMSKALHLFTFPFVIRISLKATYSLRHPGASRDPLRGFTTLWRIRLSPE